MLKFREIPTDQLDFDRSRIHNLHLGFWLLPKDSEEFDSPYSPEAREGEEEEGEWPAQES